MSDGSVLNVSSGHGNGVDKQSGSSFLATKIHAAPFVPGNFQSQHSPSSVYNSSFSNSYSNNGAGSSPPLIKRNSIGVENVKAPPFIPTSGRPLASAVHAPAFVPNSAKHGAPTGSPQKPSKMSVNATSFVPKSFSSDGGHLSRGVPETSPTAGENSGSLGHTADFGAYWRGSEPSTSHAADGHTAQQHPSRHPQPPPGMKSPPPKHMRGGRGDGGRGAGRRGGGSMGLGPGRGHVGKIQLATRFMPETMRQQLAHRSYSIQAQWGGEPEDIHVPDRILHYHTLYPLDDHATTDESPTTSSSPTSSSSWVRSNLFKGISAADGHPYTLRRINTQQVIPSGELVSCGQEAVSAWAPLVNHPNLVALKASFVSDEVDNQRAMFFVHDFHPGAVTMTQAHLEPNNTPQGLVRNAPSEEQLWSYLIQLIAGIRAVHTAGLAVQAGCLLPSKVLLTGFGRVRIGSLGILDALGGDVNRRDNVEQLQKDDIKALGRLLLVLACGGAGMTATVENLAAHYSSAFLKVVTAMLGTGSGNNTALQTWQSVCAALGDRMLTHMDTLQMYSDAMILELSKEAENGRLLRLLIKLGFINERPEHDMESQWSETGDRYILKLFRDYVFHQYADDGSTVVEWGHAVECLNKLDAGVPEKIVLLSRDEMSMLVVSFADVKRCVENCYKELKMSASRRTRLSNTGSV